MKGLRTKYLHTKALCNHTHIRRVPLHPVLRRIINIRGLLVSAFSVVSQARPICNVISETRSREPRTCRNLDNQPTNQPTNRTARACPRQHMPTSGSRNPLLRMHARSAEERGGSLRRPSRRRGQRVRATSLTCTCRGGAFQVLPPDRVGG